MKICFHLFILPYFLFHILILITKSINILYFFLSIISRYFYLSFNPFILNPYILKELPKDYRYTDFNHNF
ncbi:hypothetical protein HMPREF1984_01991 [Leptotrichia sp. oral taxon 215 str. W9775]|nr:hypothetical protein HMPREF1984_01991 [Leptotrichia sp. oral taxon 215 str. W9775]